GNAEGGIIPEEYAVEYVVDRVDTTATVWLGLTLGCARCHDHKYDPITQREFYQVFAFFNNVPEKGRAVKIGNSPPYLITPTEEQAEQLATLEKQLAVAEECFRKLEPEISTAQAAWEKSLSESRSLQWAPSVGLQAHFKLDGYLANSGDGTNTAKFQEGVVALASGVLGQAAQFDGKRFINAGNLGDFGFFDKFSVGA